MTSPVDAGLPFQLADYYKLKTISQPAVSPDGRKVAFVLEGFLKKDDDRYQNLWVVDTDGSAPPHRLTRGRTRDSSPQWSPDGRYLAFLSARPDELEITETQNEDRENHRGPQAKKTGEEEPKPQIWILDLQAGGEPRQLTCREEGVEEFSWSPDSQKIVFAARDPTPEQKEYLKALRKDKGPYVIHRVQHKYDGRGYLDDVRTHLFVADVGTRAVHQITSGPCDERHPRFSPRGTWIVFVSNRTGDADNNRRQDLWLVRPDGRDARRLTFGDVQANWPRFSPDEKWVAFTVNMVPENVYTLQSLAVIETSLAEKIDDLATFVGKGWSTIGGIVPDSHGGDPIANARVYPVPLRRTPLRLLTADLDRPVESEPLWLDENTIMVSVGDRGQTRLALANVDGAAFITFPYDRMCTVDQFDAQGGMAVVALNRPETGRELYALPVNDLLAVALASSPVDPKAVRLTKVNESLLAGRTPARYERITFANHDGDTIEALVALPPGFDPAKGPAPLLVTIHGGPMSYDTPSFRFDRQYFAGQGYLVLMVNYRGSTSYGEAFCRVIQSDWGPREHDDVMSGVDYLVERGWADPQRLFVTGFSQGGIMTNWAVGHTNRFRAAVTEHGMWDYAAAFGTDDSHLWWQDDLGVPWQNPEGYHRISPAAAVSNIHTPLLITAGEHDWRCPLDQAELLYMALKKRGVPTELVIYQDEHHAITKPRRAIDRLERICRWLEKYGGQPFRDDSAREIPDDAGTSEPQAI